MPQTNNPPLPSDAVELAALVAADGASSGFVKDSDIGAAVQAYHAALSAGPVCLPQGRLTLQTGVPVMVTTQSAKTSILYTPYQGNRVPIYDGTNWTSAAFAELSNDTTATTVGKAGPAAVANNSVYDLFVWSNAGVITLTRGPAWTNDTTRAAGTALTMVNGILLNNATITNGPAASRGTYVGTVRSNGSAQIDFIFGASAAGGTAAFFGVWNAYNRVQATTAVTDSTSSWTYSSATVRAANASNGNRISFVSGLAEDGISAAYSQTVSGAASATGYGIWGLALDSTSALDKQATVFNILVGVSAQGAVTNAYAPQLGVHFIQATEAGDGTNTTTYRGAAQQCLSAQLML